MPARSECILGVINNAPSSSKCPLCRGPLVASQLRLGVTADEVRSIQPSGEGETGEPMEVDPDQVGAQDSKMRGSALGGLAAGSA